MTKEQVLKAIKAGMKSGRWTILCTADRIGSAVLLEKAGLMRREQLPDGSANLIGKNHPAVAEWFRASPPGRCAIGECAGE